MVQRLSVVVVALGIGGATACQAVFGIDEYGGAGGATASSSGGPGGAGGGGAAEGAGGSGATGAHSGTGGESGCCVPATPPTGWEGYFTVDSSAAGTELTSCADQTVPVVLHDGLPDAVTCSGCACGPVGGATCAAPDVQCYQGSTTCTAGGGNATGALTGSCKFLSTAYDSCKLTGTAQVTSTGSCGASGGQITSKPGWKNATTLCPSVSGADTCPAGEACVEPVASDGDRVCIRSAGQVACPAGWGVATTVYDGGADGRGCSACSCAPPSAAAIQCTGGGYALFDGATAADALLACAANVGAISVSSTACVPVSQAWYSTSTPATANASGAACTPSGGAPVGAFDPGQAVTLCCR